MAFWGGRACSAFTRGDAGYVRVMQVSSSESKLSTDREALSRAERVDSSSPVVSLSHGYSAIELLHAEPKGMFGLV